MVSVLSRTIRYQLLYCPGLAIFSVKHVVQNQLCSIYYYLYAQAPLVVRIGGLIRVYSIGVMVRFRQSIYNNTDLRTTSIKHTDPRLDYKMPNSTHNGSWTY